MGALNAPASATLPLRSSIRGKMRNAPSVSSPDAPPCNARSAPVRGWVRGAAERRRLMHEQVAEPRAHGSGSLGFHPQEPKKSADASAFVTRLFSPYTEKQCKWLILDD